MAKAKKDSSGKQSLNIDWDELFPGDDLEIGGQTIVIKPLGLLKLAQIAKQVKGLGKTLTAEGVSWENYNLPENMFTLASVLLENAPEVLSESSNIVLTDIQKLPPEYIVKVLDKVFEVNLASKESLEKNFSSLAEKFKTATNQN